MIELTRINSDYFKRNEDGSYEVPKITELYLEISRLKDENWELHKENLKLLQQTETLCVEITKLAAELIEVYKDEEPED